MKVETVKAEIKYESVRKRASYQVVLNKLSNPKSYDVYFLAELIS